MMFKALNQFLHLWNTELMENPEQYFGDETIVIMVRENNGNVDNIDQTIEGGLNLMDISEDTTIDSGVSLRISGYGAPIINWCYIPFNFHYKSWVDKFRTLMGSDYPEFKANPHEYIKNHNENLRAISQSFTSDLNSTSLIIYSGPIHKPEITNFNSSLDINLDWRYRDKRKYYDLDYIWYLEHLNNSHRRVRPAAIYYGDLKLSESIIKSVCHNLRIRTEMVGTIQLPHHGSYRSFDNIVFEYYDNGNWNKYPDFSILYVISAGKNRPHHPGTQTIAALKAHPQFHEIVKESHTSGISEEWVVNV